MLIRAYIESVKIPNNDPSNKRLELHNKNANEKNIFCFISVKEFVQTLNFFTHRLKLQLLDLKYLE